MNTPVQDSELPNRGPRVTPADIEAAIASETYFTAADGARGARRAISAGKDRADRIFQSTWRPPTGGDAA